MYMCLYHYFCMFIISLISSFGGFFFVDFLFSEIRGQFYIFIPNFFKFPWEGFPDVIFYNRINDWRQLPQEDVNGRHAIYIQHSVHGPWLGGPCSQKFGHTQGVLKRRLIQIAEFKIHTVLYWEKPGYGDVAKYKVFQRA